LSHHLKTLAQYDPSIIRQSRPNENAFPIQPIRSGAQFQISMKMQGKYGKRRSLLGDRGASSAQHVPQHQIIDAE
jgi:hypothetical protein